MTKYGVHFVVSATDLASCLPRGLGEPHDIAPQGLWHLSFTRIFTPTGCLQAGRRASLASVTNGERASRSSGASRSRDAERAAKL